MINIGFKSHYKAVHVTNEIGKYLIGGMGSFMNELYGHHPQEVGFIHLYDDYSNKDISISQYPGFEDILSVPYNETHRLGELSFDIAVCHFYEFQFMTEEDFLRGRKLVYVIHSVPTAEPYDVRNPFAGHDVLKIQFENLCKHADIIICVSYAEKHKLFTIYPEYDYKVEVIHNGMQFDSASTHTAPSLRNERKVFGYIGRLDYRKGILECLREMKDLDAELWIASGNEDPHYLASLISYIEAANMQERVHFLGWCSGDRKKRFLQSLDALIVPSLYEPFGYVVLEAMNEKIPLICSTGGGIAEIIGSYKYCYDPYERGALKSMMQQFQEEDTEVIQAEIGLLFQRSELFGAELMNINYARLFDAMI